MKQLSILSLPEFGDVRSTLIRGEMWFVAKDVCDILGHSNSRKALTSLDDDEKGVTISDTLGGKQEVAIINESGFYSLMMSSRLERAKSFRRWVTSEVLPAIRRTGYYIHPSMKLSVTQQRKLDTIMRELVKEFITDRDIMRTAKRSGRTCRYVYDVLAGRAKNNGIMDELQAQAVVNKEQFESPYSIKRTHEIIQKLSR